MEQLILDHIGTLITGVIGAIGWIFQYKKRKTENKRSALELEQLKLELSKGNTENQSSVVDLYQEALDDLKKRYDLKFKDLETEIELLRKNLENEKRKYQELKRSFQEYKQKNC